MTVPRRLNGVNVEPTNETRYCRTCRAEMLTFRAYVRINGKDYADLFCDEGHFLGGYALKHEAKPGAGA